MQDRRRLSAFIESVEPVTDLEVRCRVGEEDLGLVDSRGAFVDLNGASITAFVVWDESPWPPIPENGESLATALSDLLQPGFFEAFLALVSASTDDARRKLLRLAGAPAPEDLVDVTEPEELVESDEIARTAGEPTGEQAPTPPIHSPKPIVPKTPLYQPDQLLIEADPIVVTGSPIDARSPVGVVKSSRGDGPNGNVYGGRTDLSELDRVGMAVAMTFERRRLGVGLDNDLVFDASTKEAIDNALQRSDRFRAALDLLAAKSLNPQAPGFDILTLDPITHEPQRLIELKSSGINARMQEMSWNEWKAASESSLRDRYYLYLVGNLRSDLGSARPFLRAVRDPFGSILSEEKVEKGESRSIRLNTLAFTAAEEVTLTVRQSPPAGGAFSSTAASS